MSLSILQNTTAIAAGRPTPFAGSGGTTPYVFSVLPGGAGGTINPATGLYTAPPAIATTDGVPKNRDTVQVKDAANATARAVINILSPLELVCEIISREMNLADGQVYLWDQKTAPRRDSRLYVAVGVLSCKPFSNAKVFEASGDGAQSINMQATLSIDIESRGPEARDRKEEILLALSSFYAEQQMNANAFRVFNISTNFVNLSEVDGAAITYRFNISVNIQYFVTKTKAVGYFDTFAYDEITGS